MLTRLFFKFFPPPKLLNERYAGLDISDDAIRVIQFAHMGYGGHLATSHSMTVAKHGYRALPVGMIEGGFLKDEAGFEKIVKELVAELGITSVNVSLPEEKMYLFKTEIARLDDKEIRQNIEFKLEENVPLSPGDALFNYDVLRGGTPGKHVAVVSVAPRKVIDAYLNVLTHAGLTVRSFEVAARSLARAFVPIGAPDTQIIVHIMRKKTGIYVVCNGTISFTSTVAWGGDLVTDAVAQAFGVSFDDALKIKKVAGYHDAEDTKKIFSAVDPILAQLTKEVHKIFVYWKEHGEECKDINKITLCGMDALLVGLVSTITPDPNVPVQIGNVWMNAFSNDHYIPPIQHDDSLDYAVAVGLALPQ